jgi:uncharacterized protein
MNYHRNKLIIILALILFLLFTSFAAAATPEPPAVPHDYVVDLAGVMDNAAKARLNALLLELEQKTTAQVLVLTVQSLDGQDIEGFSIGMAEKWKLGQKGKDNGALLVVAVQDRKYRFEIGYGLESVLPDSLVGTIGREYLVPYFRQGDYGTGIYSAIVVVARTIASSAGVELATMPPVSRPHDVSTGKPVSTFNLVLFGIFGIVALILFITHPRQCFLILLMSQMGGGRGGWSGGMSGGGGFGGGSFGGGGGGGFGGGGASGGW